jgi:hypothetical protein
VASCGNYLPTFRNNVSVPASRVKSPSRKKRKPATYNVDSGKCGGVAISRHDDSQLGRTVKMGPIRCCETSVKKITTLWRVIYQKSADVINIAAEA